ncbi:hypothetical protein ACROYT_G018093 [Oculina patagonica]
MSSNDHSQKAVCMISAWIFSENVGGLKLKFGEEIEQQLTDRQPSSDSCHLEADNEVHIFYGNQLKRS